MRSIEHWRGPTGALLMAGCAVLVACAARATPPVSPVIERRTVALAGMTVEYRLRVPHEPARGVVVLLGVPPEAHLPQLLVRAAIATAEPELSRERLLLDAGTMRAIELVALDAIARSGAPPGHVALGGISLGGTAAVAFAEDCATGRCSPAVLPRAVFAVDAPLDMERLWRASMARLRWDTAGMDAGEAGWIIEHLSRVLGGSPDDAPTPYAVRSPFRYDEPQGGNGRLLLATPLRLYAEPDMDFWLAHGFDYYQLNAFDAAALANRLRHMGHDDVELILTSGRGFRPDGTRNPHSWSIVDEPDLTRWLVAHLEGL